MKLVWLMETSSIYISSQFDCIFAYTTRIIKQKMHNRKMKILNNNKHEMIIEDQVHNKWQK